VLVVEVVVMMMVLVRRRRVLYAGSHGSLKREMSLMKS
jgi:hypothetical protein